MNVFSSSNEAILLLDGYMAAIMKNDSKSFFFDSHECDKSGIPVVSKTEAALLINFSDLYSARHTYLYLGKQIKNRSLSLFQSKSLTAL